MLEKNPLDLIRSMNVKKEAEKKESESLEEETLIKNQEIIDHEHDSLETQKKVLVEEVEKFKQRIGEIKGSREEMISQYHEAISEARKNPETLAYVKENFSDIFKEGKEKWQEIRDELGVVKGLESSKSEDVKNIDSKMETILPETSSGKLKIEQEETKQNQKEEEYKWKLEKQEKLVKKLEENIENAKNQKEKYSDILDQIVEYTREKYVSGEAKIISEDAKEFAKLWKQFPVNPFVLSTGGDYMVKALEEKSYSAQDIEEYKEKREKLREIEKKIYDDVGYSNIGGFTNSNNVDSLSHAFIDVGHGNHYFDSSLLNWKMPLGELIDREIEIKTKQLGEEKIKLQETESKK